MLTKFLSFLTYLSFSYSSLSLCLSLFSSLALALSLSLSLSPSPSNAFHRIILHVYIYIQIAGIGIVYESSSSEQREQLVQNLLDTLVGGRKEVAKVNQDTKVFAEGELGKNPVSGNFFVFLTLLHRITSRNAILFYRLWIFVLG